VNKKIIFSVLVLSLLSLYRSTFAGDAKPVYNLSACIAEAVKNNPMLLSAESSKQSANSVLNYQKSLFYPLIEFNIGSGYLSGEPNSPFAATTNRTEEELRVRHVSRAYYFTGLTLNYPIYKEGVMFGIHAPSVKKSEAQLGVASNNTNVIRDEILYRITEAYLNVLKGRADIKTHEENVNYLQSNYDMSLSKYKLTLLTREDLLKAESQLVTARENLANMKNSLMQKQVELAYWMGIDPLTEFEVADSVDNDFYYISIPISNIKEMIERAYEKNSLIQLKNEEVKAAKEELSIAEKIGYPNIVLTSNISTADDFNPPGRTMFHTFLELRMPVFDFGRKKYSVEEARHKLMAAEMDFINEKNRLARDIAQKITDVKNIENSITATKKNIELAQESYNHMQEEYAQNLVTLSSLLEAQYNLISQKNTLNRLTYDHRISYVNLKGFIGELSPE
jgi:outer membrane protein